MSKTITWDEWAKQVNSEIATLKQRIDYVDRRFDIIFGNVNKLEDELIRNIFVPQMQAHIVESLKSNPKTQQTVMKTLPNWIENHLLYRAFYEAWFDFEKVGVILPISHGRGHPRTWQLSLTKVNELEMMQKT